jgi:hypothetical protein
MILDYERNTAELIGGKPFDPSDLSLARVWILLVAFYDIHEKKRIGVSYYARYLAKILCSAMDLKLTRTKKERPILSF